MLGEAKLPKGSFTLSMREHGGRRLQASDYRSSVRVVVVAILLGRIFIVGIARAFGALRLSAAMSGLFVLLSIPVLIFILVYNYRQNSAAINATLNDVVAKTKQASIEDAQNLIDPVAATLELLAAVAAEDPRPSEGGRAGSCSTRR